MRAEINTKTTGKRSKKHEDMKNRIQAINGNIPK
jgi:hypothetical protein